MQSVTQVAARLADVWTRLQQLAAADLPARACERLAKAQRLRSHWLAYLAFVFATLHHRVAALDLPADIEQAVITQLIPALYLQ